MQPHLVTTHVEVADPARATRARAGGLHSPILLQTLAWISGVWGTLKPQQRARECEPGPLHCFF